jgi:hypothetical protein
LDKVEKSIKKKYIPTAPNIHSYEFQMKGICMYTRRPRCFPTGVFETKERRTRPICLYAQRTRRLTTLRNCGLFDLTAIVLAVFHTKNVTKSSPTSLQQFHSMFKHNWRDAADYTSNTRRRHTLIGTIGNDAATVLCHVV